MGKVKLRISVWLGNEETLLNLGIDREMEGHADAAIQIRLVQVCFQMLEEITKAIQSHPRPPASPASRPLTERLQRLANLMARHPDRADQIMDTILSALQAHGLQFDPQEAAGADFWERLAQADPATQALVHQALDEAGKRIREILNG